MTTDTVAVAIGILAMVLIFSPFISILFKMGLQAWRRRKPKAPPPPQHYSWFENYGQGPKKEEKDFDNED